MKKFKIGISIFVILFFAFLGQGCSILKQSSTAENLSSGGLLTVKKHYYDPKMVLKTAFEKHENLKVPEGAQILKHGEGFYTLQFPEYYEVIYQSSRSLSGDGSNPGFKGSIIMREVEGEWEVRVEGEGTEALVHAKEAVEADKARAEQMTEAIENLSETISKALPLLSGGTQ